MGVIRGGLFVLASILLFLVLILGNVFWILNASLDYDTLQPLLVDSASSLIESETDSVDQLVDDYRSNLEEYCQSNDKYIINQSGKSFEISCDILNQSSDDFMKSALNSTVNDIYYREYDCEFWDCLTQEGEPLFLISYKSKMYWQQNFYWALSAYLVLLLVMFLLAESKGTSLIVGGILTSVASLPFLKLGAVAKLFSDDILYTFFNALISKSSSIFWIVFIAGIVLILLGIALKVFGIGLKISEFFAKFKKKSSEKIEKKKKEKIVSKKTTKSKKGEKPLVTDPVENEKPEVKEEKKENEKKEEKIEIIKEDKVEEKKEDEKVEKIKDDNLDKKEDSDKSE